MLQYSPNMLKTFELCPKKFYLKYIKNISMPTNDDIFEFGKNIHALASYYLNKQFIDNMERVLSKSELEVWNYLKNIKYFGYEVVATEYSLAIKIGDKFFGGRLDALVKDNNKYYILDYKTGSAPKNAKYDFQTMIYSLSVADFFKTNDVEFVYIDLKNKNEISVSFSEKLKSEYKEKLKDILNKIEKNDFSTLKKHNDCSCEYSIICY